MPNASNTTAFYAGVWTGSVMLLYAILEFSFDVVRDSNSAFLIVAVAGLIPTYPFVFGLGQRNEGPIGEQIRRAAATFIAMGKRMFIWMFGATVVMLPRALYGIWTGGAT